MSDQSALHYHVTIHDMPAGERPRERLQHYGPEALSTAELMAILLRTGSRGENVLDLATRLLVEFEGLGGLARASFSELSSVKGVGQAKAAFMQEEHGPALGVYRKLKAAIDPAGIMNPGKMGL